MKSTDANKLAMKEFSDMEHWVQFVLTKVQIIQAHIGQLDIAWGSEVAAVANALIKISEIHDHIKMRIGSKVYSKKECKSHECYDFYKNRYQRFMHTHWRMVAEYRMDIIASYQAELNRARRQKDESGQDKSVDPASSSTAITKNHTDDCKPDNNSPSVTINGIVFPASYSTSIPEDHSDNLKDDRKSENNDNSPSVMISGIMTFISKQYTDGVLKVASSSRQFVSGGYNAIRYNNCVCVEYKCFIELVKSYDPDLIHKKYTVFNVFDELCKAGYGKKRKGLSAISLPWVCKMGGKSFRNLKFFQLNIG